MSTPGSPEPKASYRQNEGLAQSREAIDTVIAAAAKSICIFDDNLEQRGYGDPARIERLRHFLLAGRAHRLRIALHEPEHLERHEPRLIALLRQLPGSRRLAPARAECYDLALPRAPAPRVMRCSIRRDPRPRQLHQNQSRRIS